MKRFSKICLLVLVIVIMMSVLSGCGKTTYEAASGFFYSSDKGHSYGDGTKEYAVGETVYMKVMFKVTSDSKRPRRLKLYLPFPMSKALTQNIWTDR